MGEFGPGFMNSCGGPDREERKENLLDEALKPRSAFDLMDRKFKEAVKPEPVQVSPPVETAKPPLCFEYDGEFLYVFEADCRGSRLEFLLSALPLDDVEDSLREEILREICILFSGSSRLQALLREAFPDELE